MNWLRKISFSRQSGSSRALDGHLLEARLAEVERELEESRRKIALLSVEISDSRRISNALIDLTEQRFDLIYRRLVSSVGDMHPSQVFTIEREAEVDDRLAGLLAGGLKAPVQPKQLDVARIISAQLHPGVISGPLTLYGFRLNRSRAREEGDGILVLGSEQGGSGLAIYGPYKRLAPGRYKVSFSLRRVKRSRTRLLPLAMGEIGLDVYAVRTDTVLATKILPARKLTSLIAISLDFDWDADWGEEEIEFRVHQRSSAFFKVTAVSLDIETGSG